MAARGSTRGTNRSEPDTVRHMVCTSDKDRSRLWIQLVSATHARFNRRNSNCLSNRY
jgi:hypothetical protein